MQPKKGARSSGRLFLFRRTNGNANLAIHVLHYGAGNAVAPRIPCPSTNT